MKRLTTTQLFVLFASLTTVLLALSLALTWLIGSSFGRSVDENGLYTALARDLDQINAAVALVDAPGNDVFSTKDVANERAKLFHAQTELDRVTTKTRADLRIAARENPSKTANELTDELERLDRAAHGIVTAAEDVFATYETGASDAAATKMAEMDRIAARVQALRSRMATQVRAEQEKLLDRQNAYAQTTRQRVFGIALLDALLLIAGILLIRQVARRETAAAAERAQAVASEQRRQLVEDANRKLTESNRDLEEFARVASHDLQEPLRKIVMLSERLATRLGDSLDETTNDYMSRLRSSTVRMQTLIEDLLSFSRVASRAQPFRTTPLRAVVDGVLSDLEAAIEESGATIDVGPLPTIDADPGQLRQLFQNLIGNAIKFRREGVTPLIEIRAQELPGDLVEIAVRDNGTGFEQKYADQIFTVFQRLHGRSQYAGSGIGLSIVRRIAERHGGGVVAHSVVGEGSTFVVTVPRLQETGGAQIAA